MNRANQQQLVQGANQQVINIRETELNYYNNLFTVFGTNAAIIGGFTYGIMTQNIIIYTSKNIGIYKFLYFVLAATTIASSVHVILTTMLVQVYGPGLALNGPIGSMALAAEGMRQEQKQIITAVIIMVFSFAGATMWLFFCVMSLHQAICATIVFLVGMWQWYIFCERIYLRFYWKKEDGHWSDRGARESRFSSTDQDPANPANFTLTPEQIAPKPALKKKSVKLFSFLFGFGRNGKDPAVDAETSDIELESTPNYGGGVLSYIFRNPATMTEEERRSITSNKTSTTIASASANAVGSASIAGAGNYIVMEGYFTTHGRSEQHIHLISESRRWDRQYFVLLRSGDFYVYTTRNDFRRKPKSPVYSRPLRLVDYFVKVINADEEHRGEYDDDNDDDGRTILSATTSFREGKPKTPGFLFQITLVPRENEESESEAARSQNPQQQQQQFRNHWLLRCDTEEELEIWLGALRDVCPSCFKD